MADPGFAAERPSERVRGVALALAIPLGIFGAHRFYVGKTGTGLLMACTVGGLGLWWLSDLILVASGEFRDAEDRRLVRWSHESGSPSGGRPALAGGPSSEDFEIMQGELHELAERVDFLERMLAQARERSPLSAGRPGSAASE